jgi:hypothetical protein
MLIGFSGMRAAGKTTAAKILIEEFGFKQAKFAAALKHGARVAYGLTVEQTDGAEKEVPTEKLGGKAPRDVMEWLGEESRVRYGEDIWVKRWFDMHGEAITSEKFVFDDVRNEVESEAIQFAGGIVVRIHNPYADRLEILPSEKRLHLIKPNYVLANNLTDRFTDDVRVLARELGLPVRFKASEAA